MQRYLMMLALVLMLVGCIQDISIPLQKTSEKVDGGQVIIRNMSIEETFVEEGPLEREIFERINEERTERGLKPLKEDPEASKVAREYAKKMFEKNFFSHYGPEGEDVSERMDRAKANYARVGENLAFIEGMVNVSDRAVEGWIKSPRHHEVMFDPSFDTLGVGAACDEEKCYIVTIYVEKKFNLLLNLNSTIAYVKVPLNSPAGVSVKSNATATFIVLDEENLEKFKRNEEYVSYGRWRGNGFLATMTPDDYIVVLSNSTINLTVEIE